MMFEYPRKSPANHKGKEADFDWSFPGFNANIFISI